MTTNHTRNRLTLLAVLGIIGWPGQAPANPIQEKPRKLRQGEIWVSDGYRPRNFRETGTQRRARAKRVREAVAILQGQTKPKKTRAPRKPKAELATAA